jgi:hypothetical protein
MHNTFYFQLVKEDLPKRVMQCRAMHIMASLFLILYAIQFVPSFQLHWMEMLAILPAAIFIGWKAISQKTFFLEVHYNRLFRILEAGFIFMGSMHFLQENKNSIALLFASVSAFLLFLLWMESRIFSQQYIDFTETGIEIALPLQTKKIPWKLIQNVLLKNGFVSLVLPNNTILQYKVIVDMQEEELKDFYAYCNGKLLREKI